MLEKFALVFTAYVAIVWTGFGLIGAITENYTLFQLSTPVMLICTGFAVGVKVVRKNGGKNGQG